VQQNPHTNWMLVLRDVRIKVKRVLPSLFLAPIITKKKNHSNQPKPTTHLIPCHPSTPKRDVKKNTPNPSEEVYICIFCGHADHLNEFCFRCKRMEKRHVDYSRNSYHDEFIDFLPHFSSCAPSHFSHGPNHRSYGFGSCESDLVPR
jgi:hypothetical protein